MPRVFSDRIVFDRNDWENGLIPQYASGGVSRESAGLVYTENMDGLRFPGYCAPGFEPSSVTNASDVTGTIVAGRAKDGDEVLLLASDGDVHEYDPINHEVTNTGDFPHAITPHGHSSLDATEGDVLIYRHNFQGSQRTSAFYSWNDGTDWDVGTYGDLEGTPAFNDDFMSTTPADALTGSDLTDGKGLQHPMEIGEDGILYMGSGQYVHGYDGLNGSNGTFESQVLDVKQGFEITSLLAGQRYLMSFAYRKPTTGAAISSTRAEAWVFFWDYLNPDSFNYAEPLDDNYVASSFHWKGVPACMTYGRSQSPASGRGKIKVRTGGRWRTVVGFDDYPVNRGVVTIGDRIVWNSNGKLYSYGAPTDDFFGGFQRIGTPNGSTRGFTGNFSGGTVMASTGSDISEFKTGFETGEFLTNYAHLNLPRGFQAQVKYIRTKFREAASGGLNLQLDMKTNAGNTTTTFHNSEDVSADRLFVDITEDTSGNPLPKFQDLALFGQWTGGSGTTDAPVIESIEVFYEPVRVEK